MQARSTRVATPGDLLGRLTRFGKLIASVIFAGYLLSYIPLVEGLLTMYAYKTLLSLHVWNVVTCGYFELSLLSAIFSVIFILAVTMYVEPIIGSREMLKLIVLVNTASTLSLYVTVVFLHILSLSSYVWHSPLASFSAVVGAFLVVVKQMQPDFKVRYLFAFHIRAKYIPLIAMTFSLFFLAFFGVAATKGSPLLLIFGVHYSWVYLRFFQRRDSALEYSIGDGSPEFSYATFFPPFVQPYFRLVSDAFSGLLSTCGIPFFSTSPQSIGSYEVVSRDGESTPRAHSERRRILGTMIVNKKMKELDRSEDDGLEFVDERKDDGDDGGDTSY